jgi:hypothetical protein
MSNLFGNTSKRPSREGARDARPKRSRTEGPSMNPPRSSFITRSMTNIPVVSSQPSSVISSSFVQPDISSSSVLESRPSPGRVAFGDSSNVEQTYDIPVSSDIPSFVQGFHGGDFASSLSFSTSTALLVSEGQVGEGSLVHPPTTQSILQDCPDYLFSDTTVVTTSFESGGPSGGRSGSRSGRRVIISASGKETSVSPNERESPRPLDDRCILEQVKDIMLSENPRPDGVASNSELPGSVEPDTLSWDLGLSTILPGELKKLEGTSNVRLVQSLVKICEQVNIICLFFSTFVLNALLCGGSSYSFFFLGQIFCTPAGCAK